MPCSLKFEGPPVSFAIMLAYSSRIMPLRREKHTLLDPQPNILNYLKEKCSILTDLYEIINSENPSEYLVDSNPGVPVFNLLRHYNKLNVASGDSFSWFSSALSSSPNRRFFLHQIESCFSLNLWPQALLYLDVYLEYCGKKEYNLILARQLILEHISSLYPSPTVEPSNYALCISDPLCRANTILRNVYKWDELAALKALKCCLSDCKIHNYPDVYLSLKNKLREVKLYKKVCIVNWFCFIFIAFKKKKSLKMNY